MIPRRCSADSSSGPGSDVRRSSMALPTCASIEAMLAFMVAPFPINVGRARPGRHPPEVPSRVAPPDDSFEITLRRTVGLVHADRDRACLRGARHYSNLHGGEPTLLSASRQN